MRDTTFKDYIEEQLVGLDDLRFCPMFGGWGMYVGEIFFGIISRGKLYFKTDDRTRKLFERHGMRSFQPSPRQSYGEAMEPV